MNIDIKNFVEDCRTRGLTYHTIATYKSNIATFLNFAGNPLNVDIFILCKFLDHLKEMEYRRGKKVKNGVHPKTIKAYFSAISTFYEYLIFTRQIAISPIPSFTKRYLSRIKQQYNGENSRQLISIEQMKQLINLDMPILERAILMILAKTGVRRGELLSMDRNDLNLEKKEIILKPKAKRTNRLVFFDDETALVLRIYLEWRDKRTKSNALFVTQYYNSRIGRNQVNEIVARHGSTLELHNPDGSLNQKLTPHCFRHWFTTHLRRAGMPREFIQELRGDRRKDAIDIYDHIDLSELKDHYVKCIPGLLNTPLKLHSTDLEIDSHRAASPRSPKADVQYGKRTMAVLYLLKEHPEGLTVSESSNLLKDKYHPVQIQIYRNLKYGNLRKDGLKYFLTSQGCLTIERMKEIPDIQGVTPLLSDRDIKKKILEKQALDIEQKEPMADEILSKGLLQFINQKHPELVHEFLKDNGRDGLYPMAISQIPCKNRVAALVI